MTFRVLVWGTGGGGGHREWEPRSLLVGSLTRITDPAVSVATVPSDRPPGRRTDPLSTGPSVLCPRPICLWGPIREGHGCVRREKIRRTDGTGRLTPQAGPCHPQVRLDRPALCGRRGRSSPGPLLRRGTPEHSVAPTVPSW